MSEQTNIIDIAALKAYVKEVRQRASKLLSLQGTEAKPEVHEQLYDMGDEIADMTWLLAYAVTANEMLGEVSRLLAQKAEAYEVVFNLERPADTRKFEVTKA